MTTSRRAAVPALLVSLSLGLGPAGCMSCSTRGNGLLGLPPASSTVLDSYPVMFDVAVDPADGHFLALETYRLAKYDRDEGWVRDVWRELPEPPEGQLQHLSAIGPGLVMLSGFGGPYWIFDLDSEIATPVSGVDELLGRGSAVDVGAGAGGEPGEMVATYGSPATGRTLHFYRGTPTERVLDRIVSIPDEIELAAGLAYAEELGVVFILPFFDPDGVAGVDALTGEIAVDFPSGWGAWSIIGWDAATAHLLVGPGTRDVDRMVIEEYEVMR